MRKWLFMLSILATSLPLSAQAATHTVEMLNRNATGPMPFAPDYLIVQPGDRVRFVPTAPGHNAATIDDMLPMDGEAFVGNIGKPLEVTLDAEGIWGIKCSPHYTMGMVMLIQVGDTPATANDLPASLPTAARQRFDEILARHAGQ